MEGNLSTSIPDSFLATMRQNHECENPNSMSDYNQGERGKIVASDEEELNFNLEEMDCQNKGKNKSLLWHRVKWTDPMIRLLIMALSYIGDDSISEGFQGGRRKNYNLQKKGKWKSISKVMAERGFCVSPQQCEDKYNDLNKRYRKLNDILGRGTSCEVVENPAILDMMNHLSEKSKDEVRKILSSKHLFYEEMCSYHNVNRLHLPHDPALQKSLMLALRSKDDHGTDSLSHAIDDDDDDDDEEDDDLDDDHEEFEDIHHRGGCGVRGNSANKRIKQGQGGLEDFSFRNPQPITPDFQSGLQLQNPDADIHLTVHEGQKAYWMQNQWFKSQSVQLEEQRLQIQLEMLDLEKQRLKWQRYSKKKDRELETMRIENDRMRIENERMAIKLKRKELAIKCQY